MSETEKKKPLLILDMDETLLFAIDLEDDDPEKRLPLPGLTVDFQVGSIIVYWRPHVREFLQRMSAVYDLAVWSSAGGVYVRSTIAGLFSLAEVPPPLFVWSSNKCTKRRDHDLYYREYFVKSLKKVKKLGFKLERMLIVDDSPEKCVANYGNAVYIKEFNGEQADEELLHLATYLETLASAPNFRTIEKRGWRRTSS